MVAASRGGTRGGDETAPDAAAASREGVVAVTGGAGASKKVSGSSMGN
jgi:hypothetical protein